MTAPERMECDPDDFRTLMTLADTLIYHSAAMVNMLNEPQSPTAPEPSHRNTKASNLLDLLPPEFTTAEAISVGEELGITDRTVRNQLSEALNDKQIKRVARAQYVKRGLKDA